MASSTRAGCRSLILTAQIDGIRVPVEIVGAATIAGTGEKSVLLTDVYRTEASLVGMECEGRMIPNSSLAQIIMIGEFKNGREFVGGGIIETGITLLGAGNGTPMIASCAMEQESANVYLGGALGDENSTFAPVTPLSFEDINVSLKLGNGDVKSATVSGFILGNGGVAD